MNTLQSATFRISLLLTMTLFSATLATAAQTWPAVVISDTLENQSAPNIGPGTDPALFGTVTKALLPLTKPTTFNQTGTAADAYVMTNSFGFSSKCAAIYSGTASSGYTPTFTWEVQPGKASATTPSISNGTFRISWEASAAETNRKGGHFALYSTRASDGYGGGIMFHTSFLNTGYITVDGVTSPNVPFPAYSANTPLAFMLDVDFGTGTYDFWVNGVVHVKDGTLSPTNWTSDGTLLFDSVKFLCQSYSFLDYNKATFALDNLSMTYLPPPPDCTVVTIK